MHMTKLTKKMVYKEERTALRHAIENVLMTHQIPALTVKEIYDIVKTQVTFGESLIGPMHVAAQLINMKKTLVVGNRLCPNASLTPTMVPGRFVGQYGRGMVTVPEAKKHWFMTSRKPAFHVLRKQRHTAFETKMKKRAS